VSVLIPRFLAVIFLLAAIPLLPAQEGERQHWAFRTLSRPSLPQRITANVPLTNPVDAFLAARLREKGLTMAPEAERRVLIRRLAFDLIGLPPVPEEIEAFEQDSSPDAYERLVDRMLASPAYGERWGRHWLDGAGYVDVLGGDNDAATVKLGDGSKWKYRDYVVRALNEDRPWDQCLTEQIAGDELVDWRNAPRFTPDILQKLIATGFLRTAADDTDENELNTSDIRHGIQQRTGEVLVSNVLGLTFACAKCHDHKYEPILQRDYYRIMALLAPAFNTERWLQPAQRVLADVPPGEKEKLDRHNAAIDAAIKELQKTPGKQTSEKIAALQATKRKAGTVQAVYDVGPPSPTYLLKRGDHSRPDKEVAPGFLSVLCASEAATALPPTKAAGSSSGRRLALARWLTDPRTPAGALAVRVRVNRVWQHLFGRGIVATPDNFGVTGAKPTHPELLEWLACEFVAQGGRFKPLIRLLVTSSAYRQASAGVAIPASADPDNQLLWRMRLRRLESEAIRDAILAVSGQLDRTPGGPPVMTESRPDGQIVIKPPGSTRRSLYLLGRRNYHPTLLSVFDQPVLTTNCACRSPSAVVLQSLTMLNDDFVREQAGHLARRVHRHAGDTPERQVAAAFRIALGRKPTEREAGLCRETLKQPGGEGLIRLCHILLNTSEFLYVP
jgi:hypothetical protein